MNNNHQVRPLVSLRCAKCKLRHPKSPAILLWWKVLKDKDQLQCRCGSRNFVRTDSQVPQGVLISEAIDKHGNILKKVIEDDAGEGKAVKDVWKHYKPKVEVER